MYGVVTRNPEEAAWPEFDRAFHEVKSVTGRIVDPEPGTIGMIACFGDTAAGETDPSLVPVSADGTRATREAPYFDWGFVCPTDLTYRERLLDLVEETAAATGNVRLDDIGFPRAEYCYCERCEQAFADSERTNRDRWREDVIETVVAAVADRIPGDCYATIYPDPYPGHLEQRCGVDVDRLAAHVDEFVVPLYDTAYGTTYWLETIAKGFESRLPIGFSVELYAVDVGIDELANATTVASAYADHVYFGYDAGNARAVIRRHRAESRTGRRYE